MKEVKRRPGFGGGGDDDDQAGIDFTAAAAEVEVEVGSPAKYGGRGMGGGGRGLEGRKLGYGGSASMMPLSKPLSYGGSASMMSLGATGTTLGTSAGASRPSSPPSKATTGISSSRKSNIGAVGRGSSFGKTAVGGGEAAVDAQKDALVALASTVPAVTTAHDLGKLHRTLFRAEMREEGAICIQRHWRGVALRVFILPFEAVARKLQVAFRARLHMKRQREHAAAVRIQKVVRGRIGRAKAEAARQIRVLESMSAALHAQQVAVRKSHRRAAKRERREKQAAAASRLHVGVVGEERQVHARWLAPMDENATSETLLRSGGGGGGGRSRLVEGRQSRRSAAASAGVGKGRPLSAKKEKGKGGRSGTAVNESSLLDNYG
eukprot:COSAG06_NODE_351_length_16930_cov_7.238904_10_plen_378_part_00